jgi:hypothetical protein
MVWLHVPGCSPSAVDTAGSISECEQRCLALASFATWRGTFKPPPFWQSKCEREAWIALLSGVTSPPSMLALGVEQWISSWRDSLANPSRSPAASVGSPTSDGSGPTSSESSATRVVLLASSRTSPALLLPGFETSSGALPRSGSMRNGVCIARVTSVPPTSESDGSVWPTPDASVRTGYNQSPTPGATARPLLAQIARSWPTPTATDAKASGAAHLSTESGRHAGTTLTDAAVRKRWATPTATDARSAVANATQIGRRLAGDIASPRDRTKSTSGMVLNPLFVETLMGLPLGWTDYASLETESSRSKRRTRSAISQGG